MCNAAILNAHVGKPICIIEIFPNSPSSHPVIVTNSRRKRQRRRRQDKPRTVIVPDLHNPSNSLPVKLNKKQLGKLISHLMTMQNEDDSSDDEDDAVDSSGNYSKGRLTVVPSTW